MTIAVLLWPHANVRYFESMKRLAAAEMEILLHTFDEQIEVRNLEMQGIEFCAFDVAEVDDRLRRLLSRLSCAYAVFAVQGEALVPLQPGGQLRFGGDLSGVLKYKGKTNEMFSGMLVNLAVFSSEYAKWFDRPLQVLDPMCGRGTTLFEALRRDYDASGVEIDKTDVAEVRKFLKKYCEHNRLKHRVESSSMTADGKSVGTRTRFTLAENAERFREDPRTLTLTLGDTLLTDRFYKGRTFHALACDLPYGVQHESRDGQSKVALDKLMARALRAWQKVLLPGAAVALSFNANTLPLEQARQMLERAGFVPLTGGPYDHMAHWVEQAITRDIAVARWPGKES